MGSGAEADVGDAAPVGAVVDRFAARARPVGNLIVDIPRLRQLPAERVVLTTTLLVEGLSIPTVSHHLLQRTVLLYGQLVSGYVLRSQCQRLVNG